MMETNEQDKRTDCDPITLYYQRYSQNRQLPKYFCGSSVLYLPELTGDSNKRNNDVGKLVQLKEEEQHVLINDMLEEAEIYHHPKESRSQSEGDVNLSKNVSPTSSITSNRKLEWDNGADIGYNNIIQYNPQIHRSSSLPILSHCKKQDRLDIYNLKKNTLDKDDIHIFPSLCHPNSVSDNDNNMLSMPTSYTTEFKKGSIISSDSNICTIRDVASVSHVNTSSSSSENDKISQFGATLLHLKKKIGIPYAESTPNDDRNKSLHKQPSTTITRNLSTSGKVNVYEVHQETYTESIEYKTSLNNQQKLNEPQDMISSDHKNLDIRKELHKSYSQGNLTDHSKCMKFPSKKNVNLCKTKPVVVECLDNKKLKPNKKIQTSVANKITKSTQTDYIDENTLINIIHDSDTNTQNQNIVLIEISDTVETEFTKSSLTQTEVISYSSNESGSFQYFSGSAQIEKVVKIENEENILLDNTNFKNGEICEPDTRKDAHLKRTQAKQNLSKASTDVSECSQDSPRDPLLGYLISTQQSEKLQTDIDKSIILLQKLMKSTKYDTSTKKHYIKKILQRIVQSKYLEDTSTSSELFIPKKTKSRQIVQHCNSDNLPSSNDHYKSENKQNKNTLNSNVPWYPVQSSNILSQKQINLQMPTHSEDSLAEVEDKYRILMRQTDRDKSVTSPITPAESSSKSKMQTTPTSINMKQGNSASSTVLPGKQIQKSSSTERNSHSKLDLEPSCHGNNWREEKTLSEKLLEHQTTYAMAQGDNLLRYAKNERKHQISWINNEIDHLSKLKHLLEKKTKTFLKQDYLYEKALVNDMSGLKKTTTVYMVSENYTGKSSEATSPCCSVQESQTNSAKSTRNFVIHTEYTDSASSDEINFKIVNGQAENNYTCKKVSPHRKKLSQAKLFGDIKVSSENDTTNITVTARRPDIQQTFNQHGKPETCKCHKVPCICCNDFIPKQPALIGQGVYQHSTFPKSATEVKFASADVYAHTRKNVDIIVPNSAKVAQASSDNSCACKDQPLMQRIDDVIQKKNSNKKCCCFGRHTRNLEISSPFACSVDPVIDRTAKIGISGKNTDGLSESDTMETNIKLQCNCANKVSEYNQQLKKKLNLQGNMCKCCGTTKNSQTQLLQTSNNLYECDNQVEARFMKNIKSCSCGIENCKCNETIQTHQNQKDENLQFQCKCNTQEMQVVCECKEENQQTESNQADENTQNVCICYTSEVQTVKHLKHDEKQQTVEKKNNVCIQIECKCADKGTQCNCSCNMDEALQTSAYEDATEAVEATEGITEDTKYEFCDDQSCIAKGSTQKSSSSSEVNTSSSSESLDRCACCKQNNIQKYASLSDKLRSEAQPLCYPCMRQNRRTPWGHVGLPFNNPNHICRCYTVVQTATFNEVKRTIDELNCLEQLEQCCTCSNRQIKNSSKYCKHCKCTLKDIEKNKSGIAYMLTFDYEKRKKKKHKYDPKLEEIKIKIPYPHSKKKHKENENKKRKFKYRNETDETISGSSSNQNTALQNCLRVNRPNFIENLEKRRKAVFDCKSQREQNNELKKLLYLKEATVKLANPRMVRCFTAKQMKEINERNYRRLPEVQEKLVAAKNAQLRQANRLIAEQFNDKLRTQVLKGKHSLPTDVNVVSLVCTERNNE